MQLTAVGCPFAWCPGMRHDVLVDLDYARLAAAIVAARKARDWTQIDLASAAGVGEMTVQRIEKADSPTRPTKRTLQAIDRALRWEEGSCEALLRGGEPTLLSESSSQAPTAPETTASATPHGSPLPLAARDVLDRGELLDTEVIDLSEPGSDFHLLVIAKVGIKDDEEKLEKMRQAIEKWVMLRKGIRDMADYRPGPDPAPDAPSD